MDGRDMRMIERGEALRFASEAGDPIGIVKKALGQEFERDVATELRVARLVHLAHAARPDGREDLVRTETDACREGHGRGRMILPEKVIQRRVLRVQTNEETTQNRVPPSPI